MSGLRRHAPRLLATLGLLGLAACSAEKPVPTVSFANDVRPILEANCVACHRGDIDPQEASGLDLHTYAGVMEGTHKGQLVRPGDPASSTLLRVIDGSVPAAMRMPPTGDALRHTEVALIRSWVEQGAPDN